MVHFTSHGVGAGVALMAGITLVSTPTVTEAQTRSLTWTETTRVEVPGVLGALLSVTGATRPRESRQSLHIQGRTLIQEDDQAASVIDLANGRWLMIDHETRSYMTFTFEEMAQMSAEALASARTAAEAGAADVSAERAELERALADADATLDVRIRSESTGRRQSFGSGINATQHFIVAEFEATAVPEGVDQREGGSMVLLTELWQSSDVPQADALYEAWAREVASDPRFRAMAEESLGSMEVTNEELSSSLAMWNPQIAAGLLQVAEATSELEGTTIRSTTIVGIGPAGAAVDRDEFLAWTPESTGDQVRGAAADAARQAAASAAAGAVRGLFGRGGGGNAPTPTPAAGSEEVPGFSRFLRITTSREDVAYRESNEDVVSALEARIGDYRARTLADLMAEMQQ